MLQRAVTRVAAPMPLSIASHGMMTFSLRILASRPTTWSGTDAVCAPRCLRPFSSSSNHHGTHHRQPTSRVQSGLDYYSLLEVHRHRLDEGELKAAYYRLAKQFHPDAIIHLPDSLRKHAEARFQQIGVAYAVLSDPRKRQEYDIFMDLSSIGDQDRMLHWVKINRPPDQLGFHGFTPTYEQKSAEHKGDAHTAAHHSPAAETAAATTPAAPQRPAPKPKIPGMPVFRSS